MAVFEKGWPPSGSHPSTRPAFPGNKSAKPAAKAADTTMSSNRYTDAEAEFFNNNDANDDNKTVSPSGNGSSDEPSAPIENETSDFYVAVNNAERTARGFVKAHPDLSTNWAGQDEGDLHAQVRWLKALYEESARLGERQRELNETAIGFGQEGYYADAFGEELPTIESEAVPDDALALLSSRVGATEEFDQDAFEKVSKGLDPLLVPVIDGEALPVLVKNEAQLEEALTLLGQLPEEPDTEGEDLSEWPEAFAATAKAMEIDPSVLDANLEGHPVPATLTIEELREEYEGMKDETCLQMALDAEMATKNRKGGKKVLRDAIAELHKDDPTDEELRDEDEFFGDAEGDEEPQEAPKGEGMTLAERADLAMSLVDGGMDMEEAKEQVGL